MAFGTVVAIAVIMVACSGPPPSAVGEGVRVGPPMTPAVAEPRAVQTWFTPGIARELIAARIEFDHAELRAIAEFDQRMGQYSARVSMPLAQYRDQVSGPALRQREWSAEQRRRSALASGPRDAAVDEAEAMLQRRCVTALTQFFAQELRDRRITPADYDRLTRGELGTNYFPSIRRRKWTGPAVIAFRAPIRTPEYRQVLQEVRRLWAAAARGASIEWVEATPAFYERLLATSPRGVKPDV
jgi:hypothetical protein